MVTKYADNLMFRSEESNRFLTLFRMGLFEAAHRWKGQKDPSSLKSVTRILQ